MLHPNDLQLYLKAFARSGDACGKTVQWPPPGFLDPPGHGLRHSDVLRLSRVVVIAELLNEAPGDAAMSADTIARKIGDQKCAALDDNVAWDAAIAWARANLEENGLARHTRDLIQTRQRRVADATRRLREQKYAIMLNGHGPQMSADTRQQIARIIDTYVACIGGFDVVRQVFQILRDGNRHHDGMWLFGDQVPAIFQSKTPSVPWGWLISLSLKHMGKKPTASKPAVMWKSMVELAIDFATVLDCERYDQFDGMIAHPGDFLISAVEGLTWREVFALPQVPPLVLGALRKAFAEILTTTDKTSIGVSLDVVFDELERLLRYCSDDIVTLFPAKATQAGLPNLLRLGLGKRSAVNPHYRDPLKASDRNQEGYVLFEMGDGDYFALSRSLVTAAACELVFGIIWKTLERERAAKVVGDVIEKAIAAGCADKTKVMKPKYEYKVGKDGFEMDVSCRSGHHIVLIEAKAKVLTREARSFDVFTYLKDYSNSYLALLTQLARHEYYLKQDESICPELGERELETRVVKIAISPLSFGPISDKAFSNQVYCSMANVDLKASNVSKDEEKAVDAFNKAKGRSIEWVAKTAPRKGEKVDVFDYMMDFFWLDLGQFLYVLERADNLTNAIAPLRNLTYSTRDFWTEVAIQDRQGLTAKDWKPAMKP